ncbi:MAG: hypothetical protein IH998_17110 [Proteobacteria bacterium]|nr:hypothetical protein [Pseudomonadota bacterium]
MLYADAAGLEVLGVFMVAWTDIEAKLSTRSEKAIRRARTFIRGLPGRLRRARGSLAWQIRRRVLAVANWYRRRRGQPQRIEARGIVAFDLIGRKRQFLRHCPSLSLLIG